MTTEIKLTWKGGRVMQRLNTAAKKGVNRAGKLVLKEMRRLMLEEPKSGKMYGTHRASAPGEPPASETGRMVASFRSEKIELADKPGVKIEVKVPYFKYTEQGTKFMKPRPLLETTIRNLRGRLEKEIVREIAQVLKAP